MDTKQIVGYMVVRVDQQGTPRDVIQRFELLEFQKAVRCLLECEADAVQDEFALIQWTRVAL